MKEAIETLRQSIVAGSKQAKPTIPLRRVMNEWEVVFLLGAISKEAGFRLYQGSDAFPDAVLEVSVNGELKQIKTELEYRASRFHHSRSGCDLVICWRADARIGDLPIIELHPLFPELDAERDNLEIDHEKKNSMLREVFFSIQDWLYASMKLVPSGTGSKTDTNTVTFKDGPRSVCSLQYDTKAEYLQFKWFKDTLKLLGKREEFVQRFPSILGLMSVSKPKLKSETATEYHINIFPEDSRRVDAMLGQLGAIFAL